MLFYVIFRATHKKEIPDIQIPGLIRIFAVDPGPPVVNFQGLKEA
jgi:hypothetical protein